MSWVKVDDKIFLNPKFRRASDGARLLYFSGLCFAAQAESDGAILASDLPVVAAFARTADASAIAAELVSLRLWEATDGGHQIHDYLEYQPSRSNLEAERKRKRDWAAANSGASSGASSASSGTSNSAPVATSRSRSRSRSGSPSPNQDTCPSAAAPGRVRARRNADVSEAFSRIWHIYPRRDAKAKAAAEWGRQVRDQAGGEAALVQAVTSTLAWQLPHWQATDREYPAHAPYLASYLHQQRWTDERPAAARPQARPGQPEPFTWPDLPGLDEVGT